MARQTLWCPILLLLLIGDGVWSPARAQTAPPPPTPPATAQTTAAQAPAPASDLKIDLERIKSALEVPIKVKIADGKVRFFTETVASSTPSFKDLTVNFNLRTGPVPGAGMTHEEFLAMVTPQVLYSSSGINALDTLQWGIVNHAGWWAVRKLYKELSETVDENRIKAIRLQIDRELAALRGGK